jgi:hypothetical protein
MSNNLKMHLLDAAGAELPGALYAKVVGLPTADGSDTTIRFTSMSPEIRAYLRQQRG